MPNNFPMLTVQTSPGNPNATTSTTLVQAGIGTTFTPQSSGKILILVTGIMYNATTGDGVEAVISYAAGSTVPSNGATATGTTAGNTSSGTSATANYRVTLICVAYVLLTPGTEYWCDLQYAVLTGGTGNLAGLIVTVIELPN